MSRNFIRQNIIRVKSEKLDSVTHFYTNICGMEYVCQSVSSNDHYPYSNDGKLHTFSYKQRDGSYPPTGVCIVADDEFSDHPNDRYWKIGIAVQDVNAAVQHFNKHGVTVKPAGQFVDVGYLTSLPDPAGYQIELLQHTFEGNFKEMEGERGVLNQHVTQHPTIGQITIRCSDPGKTCHFYTKVLGMKLVCTEVPGNKYPFTLYFFAYTDDDPPNPDLSAVQNREWLYQKPYCQIEVQHRHNIPPGSGSNQNETNVKLGHVGVSLEVSRELLEGIATSLGSKYLDGDNKGLIHVHDPDGCLIEISCKS